jgi:hypothetical protein
MERGERKPVGTSFFRQYARSYGFFNDSLIRSLASSDKVSPKGIRREAETATFALG